MNRVIALFVFASVGIWATGQDISLPVLELSHVDDFRTYDSYPAMCVSNVYEDRRGKLWLTGCESAVLLGAPLFTFDGYKFELNKGEISRMDLAVKIESIEGDTLKGNMVNGNERIHFKMNLIDQSLTYFDTTSYNSILKFFNDNNYYKVVFNRGVVDFEIKEKGRERTVKIDLEEHYGIDSLQFLHTRIFQNELWIYDLNTSSFVVINMQSMSMQKLDMSSYTSGRTSPVDLLGLFEFRFTNSTLSISFQNNLDSEREHYFFTIKRESKIKLDLQHVIRSPGRSFVFEDNRNQLLYVYEENNEPKAFLEKPNGDIYDASPLVKDIYVPALKNIISDNFLDEFYMCRSYGVSVNKVKVNSAVRSIPMGTSLREINSWPDGKLILNAQDRRQFIYDLDSGEVFPNEDENCYELLQHLKRKENEYWSTDNQGFSAYNVKTGRCKLHLQSKKFEGIRLYLFYNEKSIIFATRSNDIWVYDIESQIPKKLIDANENSIFREITIHNFYLDSRGRVLILCSDGLYQIDVDSGEASNITPRLTVENIKLLSFAEDEEGNYWIGTSISGLIIYDPKDNTYRRVNSNQGLCNNTIATITRDENNMFWLGTYNGIALLDSDGTLITNFYKKDGLVHNECNRYSSFVLEDGRIAIGSVEGFTLIDPNQVLELLNRPTDIKIYLSEANYLDRKRQPIRLAHNDLKSTEPIILQPESKNLRLEFAISNYIRPLENKYFYKIDKYHSDWVELGNQNYLDLRDLRAGLFNVEIMGADYRGNPTSNILTLKVKARQFFYQSGWFYFLLLGIISSIVLLGISSLRRQVKMATEEIIRDKKIIEEQTEQLKELDKAKSEFFTNISHEFKTPLTIISGIVEQIKQKPTIWMDKGLAMIKKNSMNLLNLVDQILELRKLESNSLTLNMVQGEIITYLKYLVSSLESLATQNDVKLSFSSEIDKVIMDHDEEKLLRIITNLISNAIKYNKKGGEVNVHVSFVSFQGETSLKIDVQDTGKGISPEDLNIVFERYFQASPNEGTNVKGTGIGLSLTKELVELFGGQIKATSIVDKGSMFTVILPISNKAEIQSTPVIFESTISPIGITENLDVKSFTKSEAEEELPHLLLVEDTEEIITLMLAQLGDHYDITVRNNGEQGLQTAIEQIPDIILSDVMMPRMSGIEMCEALKTNESTSHIPIILLTAKSDKKTKIEGLTSKADAFLSKPVDIRELMIRLSNLLQLRKDLHHRYKELNTPLKGSETPREDAFVLKLRTAISEHIEDDKFGVAHLCRAVGLSRSQLHKKIKALTGLSAAIYIRTVRLQRARALLLTDDVSISDVAYSVGFSTRKYFSSSYTEEFGESPSTTALRKRDSNSSTSDTLALLESDSGVFQSDSATFGNIGKNTENHLPKLLIVEDNESIIALLLSQLEGHYSISYQKDGETGLKAAHQQIPDIIISDIVMPGMNGIDLCEALKTDLCTSHIPIILLTAKADLETKIKGLSQKADAYLSKPFAADELKLTMSNLLEIRSNLHRRFKELTTPLSSSDTPIEDSFILRLRNTIIENMADESFGIQQICKKIGMSRSQLHNKLKALTGLSTSHYVRSVKLKKAKDLLRSTSMNVSEVAYAVGFKNPHYFSSTCKNEFGENPSTTKQAE